MSNYTKLNLLELEDTVGGRVPGIEGRFGRTKLGARDVGVSHWRYAPGLRAPAATGTASRRRSTSSSPAAGRDAARRRGRRRSAPWDTVRVAPEVVRAFAAGPDGLEIIAVGGPKPEGGDGEPAPVEWPA